MVSKTKFCAKKQAFPSDRKLRLISDNSLATLTCNLAATLVLVFPKFVGMMIFGDFYNDHNHKQLTDKIMKRFQDCGHGLRFTSELLEQQQVQYVYLHLLVTP